jgi:hypothetical protein
MGAERSVAGRLAELAREYEAPMTNPEWVQSRLRWEDLGAFRREAVALARIEILRGKWRGARGGMPPGGINAEDVGGEAIAELLGSKGRLAAGLVRARVSAELKRLVWQKVRSLRRLREASAMRGEWDVLPPEDGESVSVFERMASKDSRDGEAEAKVWWQEAVGALQERDHELAGVLECLLAGVRNPAQIAQRLRISEKAARNARRRLARALVELGKKIGDGLGQ